MSDAIQVPEKPPLSWLYDDPQGAIQGQTLVVDYDGSLFGEPGRAYGLVQPPDGRKYIGGGRSHGHVIPPRYPDETLSDFHVGPMQFMEGDKVVQRQVGSIAVEGGHSDQSPDFAVLAESGTLRDRVKGAVDWLQRRGKHAHLVNELGVYGRISRVQSGPARGALVFRGAAYPWLTRDQAMAINATTHSSEQWKHPDWGREQFIGVARVHQSSYRNDIPEVLAGLDSPDDAMGIIHWLDENADLPIVGETLGDESTDSRARITVPDVATKKEPMSANDEPVLAEINQSDFDAQAGRINAIDERIDRIEQQIASLTIQQLDGDDLTIPNQVDHLNERIPLIEQTLVEMREMLARLNNGGSADNPALSDGGSPLLSGTP